MQDDIKEYPTDNFFSYYFNDYIGYPWNTEAHIRLHRWCAISAIATILGRNFTLQFGFFNLIPNQYIQIIGEPATRKSTAIKQATNLLDAYGYKDFSPEKVSHQNQFLGLLHEKTWGNEDENNNEDFLLDNNIFATSDPKETAASLPIAEMLIASDEFVDFIGRNNLDFISLLGTLWDFNKVYDFSIKHGKKVYINKPTINIISGNTPESFNEAFPPHILGQGFFSRLLLIHAEKTGRKIANPLPPSIESINKLVDYLRKMRLTCLGECLITDEADILRAEIYNNWKDLSDIRFNKYSGRRYTHLLKLAMVFAAARLSNTIHTADILMANTILTVAEYDMPKAMGEFGRGRNSAVSHKILELILNSHDPVSMTDIIKHVHMDVDNPGIITNLVISLIQANKIQQINGGLLMPIRAIRQRQDNEYIKISWLHPDEY